MGNTQGQQNARAIQFDKIVNEKAFETKDLMLENKFFKSFLYTHKNQLNIFIKIYMKDKSTNLVVHRDNLQFIRKQINSNSHLNIIPYQLKQQNNFEENKSDFVFVMRQSIHTTLLDKFTQNHHMFEFEQLWIVTQIICAIHNLHSNDIYHGDLKSSNVLLTTSNHVFLSDIASFKPYYIAEDDQEDLRIFYTNSNLAPEKFVNSKDNQTLYQFQILEKMDIQLLEQMKKMDMFSLGCLIAETLLNGKMLFDNEQLQQYKRSQYDVSPVINQIKNISCQKLVFSLIDLNPDSRKNINDVLQFWFRNVVNNLNFEFLYLMDSVFNHRSFILSDIKILAYRRLINLIHQDVFQVKSNKQYCENIPVLFQNFDILENFRTIALNIKPDLFNILEIPKPQFLNPEFQSDQNSSQIFENLENSQILQIYQLDDILKIQEQKKQHNQMIYENPKLDVTVSILIKSCLSGNIANLQFKQSYMVAIQLIRNSIEFLDDKSILYLVLPILGILIDEEYQQSPTIVNEVQIKYNQRTIYLTSIQYNYQIDFQ